ncbi:MAG TPA: pyruvate kinase [Thermoanaerobaculia bacterium]|nr:pyruvate kinase [Thermoanaerobaculia bacterium]
MNDRRRAAPFRRTKIVATLGPATDRPGVLRRILEAGVDIVRLNASHGDAGAHRARIDAVRRLERVLGRPVPIVFDLSGPKIRTGTLPGGARDVLRGQRLVLAPESEARTGEIPVNYAHLARDVSRGDRILVDDGLLEWVVESVRSPRVACRVKVGGVVRDHKGLNFPGVSLSIGSLTAKDRRDVAFAAAARVDFLAQSFVRSTDDLRRLKALLLRHHAAIPIIAKIEKPEALGDLDGILRAADGIMVARGDLGVELPAQDVPEIQKRLIRRANEEEIPVITATQMLESMIEHARPTRAEASDVANAIFDGTDAVMLSAETASGAYPVESVAMMATIALRAEESEFLGRASPSRRDHSVAHAVALAACQTASEVGARAVVCFTETGRTALLLAKFVRGRPIYAMARRSAACRRATLYPGVTGITLAMPTNTDRMIANAKMRLERLGLVRRGDRLVIVSGSARVRGATNLMKVDTV